MLLVPTFSTLHASRDHSNQLILGPTISSQDKLCTAGMLPAVKLHVYVHCAVEKLEFSLLAWMQCLLVDLKISSTQSSLILILLNDIREIAQGFHHQLLQPSAKNLSPF